MKLTNWAIDFGFLSAGTDGEDGNVPIAGAFFNGELIQKIKDSELAKTH